jgi:single-strand DNA-binding protein
MNVVVLQGALSRTPELRILPSGDRMVAYEVTIRTDDQPTDSVPVVWFSPPAKASELVTGTEVVVTGKVRRRFFRTPGGTGSRTEVVAEAVLPVRQAKRCAAVVAAAAAALAPVPA